MIQLAWLWLRHQPRSALTLWFKDRTERNGSRRRKTTIVALARKLLVALNNQTAVSRETRQSVPVRRASCAHALRRNPRVEL
jgi:hypothetical protein